MVQVRCWSSYGISEMIPFNPQIYEAFIRNKIHGILSFTWFSQVISVGWPMSRLLGALTFKAVVVAKSIAETALPIRIRSSFSSRNEFTYRFPSFILWGGFNTGTVFSLRHFIRIHNRGCGRPQHQKGADVFTNGCLLALVAHGMSLDHIHNLSIAWPRGRAVGY